MKKLLLAAVVACSVSQLSAQNAWRNADQSNVAQKQRIREQALYAEHQQLLTVDMQSIKQSLANATGRNAGNGVMIQVPNVKGEMEQFRVWEHSNFEAGLQEQFPEIRSYIGKGVDGSTIHFSVSQLGIQTMTLRPDRTSEFIEPYTQDRSVYVLFDSATRVKNQLPLQCTTADVALNDEIVQGHDLANRSNTQSYKTMRLALSCTGEYGAYFGSQANAIAAMNNTMTRVNGVLEIDLAIHLNMIANNATVVYTNANTDPYSPASGMDNWNTELMNNLHATLGDSAFDIGHLFGATGGGGNAGCIGCVCTNVLSTGGGSTDSYKGSGYTSPADGVPQGDTFDIDYVIHEMGHQMGANHSFSHSTEGTGVNVEPGSGSTIMGYAGITDYDVQSHSDAYFAYRSILQIQTNMEGKTCPVSVAVTNTPPTVSAGADFTVPSGTAYILKGSATDADGDTLNYCWEQNNSAGAGSSGANSICYSTKATGPNFRSFLPKTTPNRYLPDYNLVLQGKLFTAQGSPTNWESVSTISRSLKFTLTVRDNHAGGSQTNTDEVTVTSAAPYNGTTGVGPFAITSQNAAGVVWGAAGSTETVSWSVNNTTSLPGSANVNIKLSLDGGLTWPITLASNTPNDGIENISVPGVLTTTARLLIEPTDNVYYAINSTAFAIGYEAVTVCNTYNWNTAFTLPNTGSSSYTVKTINVPTAGTISDVNIHVNATHPNLQNLSMAVIRPGGSIYTYYNQQCSGSANMDVTFDSQAGAFTCGSPLGGTMAPATGDFTTLNGFQQQGNWQFGFRDTVSGADSGSINSFWIEICSQTLVPLANKQFSFENFALYPNPNNGSFKVQFDNASDNVNITVHDLSGRRIFQKDFRSAGLFAQDIQLTNAQTGVYLVTVTNGDQKIVKRIAVE